MTVTPIDRITYRVQSESGKSVEGYTVDLSANGGCGQCDCNHWRMKIAPKLKEMHPAELLPARALECKHIKAAALLMADAFRVDVARAEAEKRHVADNEYAQLRAEFLGNPIFRKCGVCRDEDATDIHHSRGRLGRLLTNQRYWLPVCRQCHDWIHANPDKARARGFLCDKGQWNKQD